KLGLQTPNHLGSVDAALGQWLEIDLDAATVQRGICSIDADEGGKAFDCGIFQNDVGESPLTEGHRRKGDILGALGNPQNDASVLNRKKVLRNVNIQKNRANQSCDRDKKRGRAIAQHELQRPAVKSDDGIKDIF